MEKKKLLLKGMRQLAFVTCVALALVSELQAQVVSNVVNGASSIDVTINTPRTGKLYYELSTVNLNSPSAATVKQNAITATTTSKIRAGTLAFALNDLNTAETLLMANLASNQTYFLYCVFENDANGLEMVESFTLFAPLRQPEITYISTVAGQVGATARYLLYKPEVAYKNPTQPQPLLLFFHGDGEKGTNIEMVKRNGPPRLINEGQELGFIVASPQIYWPIYWDRPGYLEELIAKIRATQNIDTNRIYITGLSGGGGGIYYYTGHYPTKVAAMIPVSAVNILSNPCSIKDIAFWGFHNLNDPTVSVNNLNVVVNGINACVPAALVAPLRTIYPTSGHDSWTVTYYNQEIYAWLLTKTKNSKLNVAPVVNAGTDQTVGNYAYLKGTASDNQSISKYFWEKLSGPEATILNRNQASASVKDLVVGNYVFRLTVTDNAGASVSDVVSIVSSATAQNQAPIVTVEADVNTVLSALTITLSGSAVDPDGSIASVSWSKTSGPSVAMINTNTTSLILANVVTGNYVFRLTATDNKGAIAFDDMNLTVSSPIVPNQLPVVSAGTDVNTALTSDPISLTASATDADGSVASKLWTQISGPTITLSNTTTNTLLLTNVVTGNYVFRFTATDNLGASAFDNVNVNVSAPVVPVATISGNGLDVSYFNNINLTGTAVLTGIDNAVNFNWGAASPNVVVNVNNFSARWQGQVFAPVSGSVIFSTTSDDGVRLWVNNVLVIDNWNPHASTINTASVTLTQGQLYDIKLEYYENWGNALISLAWAYAGQNTQIIPNASLLPPAANARMEGITEEFLVTDKAWNVYPNPVSKVLYVQASGGEAFASIVLKNILGQEVYRGDNQTNAALTSIPVSGFQTGVYFIEITTNTEKITKRIVVE